MSKMHANPIITDMANNLANRHKFIVDNSTTAIHLASVMRSGEFKGSVSRF
jgi:hypothetical protein